MSKEIGDECEADYGGYDSVQLRMQPHAGISFKLVENAFEPRGGGGLQTFEDAQVLNFELSIF